MRILVNARIRTLDPRQPEVSALALAGDRVAAAGSDSEILALAGPQDTIEDLNRQVVWPGLTDAHLHLQYYSLGLRHIDVEVDTRSECLRRVHQKAAQTPPGGWVLGHGWNQNVWPEGFGDGRDLSAAAPDHPVYITAKSLHAGWANATALQRAGISADTPNPPGGEIQRDASGQPTGFVFESAMNLVEAAVPAPTVNELAAALLNAQQTFWKMGITSVHDYDGRTCFMALQSLVQQDRLRLRVNKGIPVEQIEHAVAMGLRSGFGGPYLRIGSLKLFADGALGPRTAAMLQPYENEAEYTGVALLDAEQILEYGQLASRSGLSLAIHAIGDRANHEVLNAYEQLRAYEAVNHLPHLRHRIEHVQLLHPQDYERLARYGVIASMQPIHATSDMFISDQHWGGRSAGAYAWRTQREVGAVLAFGSDAPVESPNPFLGLHAAVTRMRTDGTPGKNGWRPEQRLNLAEALEAYTLGPAFAAHLDGRLGRLAPGFYADLIVLRDDPFALPPDELWKVRPAATMVAGDWVWRE